MAGDTKDIGSIELVDAEQPHRELLKALGDNLTATARVIAAILQDGQEIIALNNGDPVTSQYAKLRVQRIVLSGAAVVGVLTLGTKTYTFDIASGTTEFHFPIVIERGTDMLWTGAASRAYLIGTVE